MVFATVSRIIAVWTMCLRDGSDMALRVSASRTKTARSGFFTAPQDSVSRTVRVSWPKICQFNMLLADDEAAVASLSNGHVDAWL